VAAGKDSLHYIEFSPVNCKEFLQIFKQRRNSTKLTCRNTQHVGMVLIESDQMRVVTPSIRVFYFDVVLSSHS